MMKKEKLFLLAIVLLAFILRVYQLGQVPPSLGWDEIAQGYNAFSILKTGADEHQKHFPQTFLISFGDYKPPLYTYTIIPVIAVLGLNEFAVRFPSAFFGSLTVLLVYYLVKELFSINSPRRSRQAFHLQGVPPDVRRDSSTLEVFVSLIAAFLLAISPWHLQLSRAAFEANLATFLVVAGILFFFKGLKKARFWLLTALFFSLSFYTFNTPRVFIPILIIGILIFYRKLIFQNLKWAVLSGVFFLLLVAPLVPHLLSEEGRLRFKEVNIFSDLGPLELSNQRIAVDGNQWWAHILHNRRLVYAQLFAKHYFDHFRLDFLFLKGDRNPRFSLQDTGELYLIELPFLILGVFYLIKDKFRHFPFLFFWFLTASLPAATARETPHALRTEVILPTYQIFISYGIFSFFNQIKKINYRIILAAVLVSIYAFSVFYFLHNYFSHYSIKYASEWQYGYKQAVKYISKVQANYDQVVVSRSLGRPYIFFLFYQKYPPRKFWQTKKEKIEPFGMRKVLGFGKYYFGRPQRKIGKTLYVEIKRDMGLKKVKILKTIYLLNGQPVFYIYED